jgi:hypothetical protein
VYQLIAMNQQDPTSGVPTNPPQWGKNITPGLSGGNTAADLFNATHTPPSLADTPDSTCAPFYGDIHYAASKVRSDGSRFLFVTTNYDLIVYQLPSTGGINYLKSWTYEELSDTAASGSVGNMWDGYQQTGISSELEIYEDVTNNKIKVAMNVFTGGYTGHTSDGWVALITFPYTYSSSTFKPLTCDAIVLNNCYSGDANIEPANVRGIEFSPDGNSVYVVHSPTECNANYVDAYSFSTPTSHTTISTSSDYEFSQIEMGYDGNMYLFRNVTPKQLARISSPNTPNPANLSTGYLSGLNSSLANPTDHFLPDQIDQETYGSQYTASTACCIFYNSYDKDIYNTAQGNTSYSQYTSTNQVWKPNTVGGSYQYNPFLTTTGNTVTIGKELRIASGYTVTIQNMTIKFSPQATCIVEGYNGTANGKLILKKCTLDVDTRCQSTLWPGIRVWGDSIGSRTFTNKGYIFIDSLSVIQNAYVGVELGYNATYAPTWGALPSDIVHCGGGNIVTTNSSFINNQRDIVFDRCQFTSGGASSILTTTCTTNATMLGSIAPRKHISFTDYKPSALIKGTTITCLSSLSYFVLDTGIYSINSNYQADQTVSPTVNNSITNMNYGIYAVNTGGNTATISAKHTTFGSNICGAYLLSVNNAIIENDTFKLYNKTVSSGAINTYGLFLDNSTGYYVQDDYFVQNSRGSYKTYGIVASNSGPYANGIFRNTFGTLYKGIQPQYRNYVATAQSRNGTGLLLLCNIFTNNSLSGADIYIPQTGSTNNVGTAYTDTAGIGNLQGNSTAGGGNRYTADNQFSHTTGGQDFYIENGKAFASTYEYYASAGNCGVASVWLPSTINRLVLACTTLAASPDCSTGGTGHRTSLTPLQQALLDAASYKVIYDSLNSELANGNNSEDVLKGISGSFTSRHLALDEAIRILLRNYDDTSEVQAHALLKEKALELPPRVQVITGLDIRDSAMAANALNAVIAQEGQSNFVKLHSILVPNINKTPQQILADPNNLSLVQSLDNDSSDRYTYVRANTLLMTVGLSNFEPYAQPGDSTLGEDQQSKFMAGKLSVDVSNMLYCRPNPFKENTTIRATVGNKTDNAYVVITDMLGKEVGRYKVVQGENEIAFTSPDNQQVLFCTLMIDGVKIKTNKMVLIK